MSEYPVRRREVEGLKAAMGAREEERRAEKKKFRCKVNLTKTDPILGLD